MILKTITTACLMDKLAQFMSSSPAEKVAYARARVLMLRGSDLTEVADEVVLGYLVNNELQMGQLVEHYQTTKHLITPGLSLNKELLAMTNEFVNVAVMEGIDSILRVLELPAQASSGADQEVVAAIDALFVDRDHLTEKLTLLRSLIESPVLQSEMVYTDVNTYSHVYHSLDPDSSFDELYGRAFLSFMGVELCMLIHERCLEVNTIYTPKVAGFMHEFYLFIVLHELSHLLLSSDDNAYSYAAEDQVKDYNVYSLANLGQNHVNNADNYCTLIFIALACLHREGRIDLTRF